MAPARITRRQRVAFSAISWPKSSRRPIASSAATSARSRSRRSRRACRSKAGSCCVGHQPAFDKLTDEELTLVATRLRDTVRRLHAALAAPPHTVLLHSAPVGEDKSLSYDWHLEIVPRLLPLPGLAWDGGLHINPVSPEEAAAELRSREGD